MRGKLCLAFPDTYAIGMSHHGLQVLYAVMNRRDGLGLRAGLRPMADMEAAAARAPVCRCYSLENVHAAWPVRRAGLHPAVRPVLHATC